MTHQLDNLLENKRSLLLTLLLMSIFAIACGQNLLYSSNQNSYFLHGLADAGFGFLNADWMANTVDPFVVFSGLVSFTEQYLSPVFFYLYYGIILGIFIYAIMGIAAIVWGINRCSGLYLSFFVIVTLLCSTLLDSVSMTLLGASVGKLAYTGLADQYILGRIFQPSTFGVLLVLSVYAFLRNRPYIAVLCIAIAATVHPSYLFSGAVLTLSYMAIVAFQDKDWRKSMLIGSMSLVLVTPIVAYALVAFQSSGVETAAQAQSILVESRIPHHANPEVWFGKGSLIRLLIIVMALLVLFKAHKQRLFVILSIPFVIAILLTLIQIYSDSAFLALLFPWRVSALLVPLSSCILLGAGLSFVFERYQSAIEHYRKTINNILLSCVAVVFIGGVFIQYNNSSGDLTLVNHVSAVKSKTDLYLIPLKMSKFRLQTGVRILVDWKTHPYKDDEVVTWYDRVQLANAFYSSVGQAQCKALDNLLAKYPLTHIVIAADNGVSNCANVGKTFDDGRLLIYKIVRLG